MTMKINTFEGVALFVHFLLLLFALFVHVIYTHLKVSYLFPFMVNTYEPAITNNVECDYDFILCKPHTK